MENLNIQIEEKTKQKFMQLVDKLQVALPLKKSALHSNLIKLLCKKEMKELKQQIKKNL